MRRGLLLAMGLCACSRTVRDFRGEVAPQILAFSVEPASVTEGDPVTLTFHIANGVGSIAPSLTNVSGSGTLVVHPARTSSLASDTLQYTLQVTGESGGTIARSVSVTVFAAAVTPVITVLSTVSLDLGNVDALVQPAAGTSYEWSIAGGNIISSNLGASVVWAPLGLGTTVLTCTARNALGAAAPAATAPVEVVGMQVLAGEADIAGQSDGAAAQATFSQPKALARRSDGMLYVADAATHTIRQITPGGVVSTLVGPSETDVSRTGCTDTPVRFQTIRAIALSADESFLVVADAACPCTLCAANTGGILRRIDLASNAIANFTNASMGNWYAFDVALDDAGDAFTVLRQAGSNDIRVVKISGDTWSGPLWERSWSNTAPSPDDDLPVPSIAVSHDGKTLYVGDGLLHTIYEVDVMTQASTLLAGSGDATLAGYDDGAGAAARFTRPTRISLGADGNLYVVDIAPIGGFLRQVAGGVTTTLGQRTAFPSPAHPTPWLSQFPGGLVRAPSGDFFIADRDSQTIILFRLAH